jgi:ABC-type sugar transport system ATPase subunit
LSILTHVDRVGAGAVDEAVRGGHVSARAVKRDGAGIRPAVHVTPPTSEPDLPLPEESLAVVPLVSSKRYQAAKAGNFYAGQEPVRPRWLGSLGWVSDGAMAKETETLLEKLQVNISRDDEIGIMSGGQRQAVACARAIPFGRRIVILDEPTSALGARESGNVLRLIKDAPENGVSVIVISHNLEHVTRVADRAVVLRQGKYVGESSADAEHHEELVSMIVGSGETGEDDGAVEHAVGSGAKEG